MSDTLEGASADLDYQQDTGSDPAAGGYAGPPITPAYSPTTVPAQPIPTTSGGGSLVQRGYTPPLSAAQRWAQAKDEGQAFNPTPFIQPYKAPVSHSAFMDFGREAFRSALDDVQGTMGAVTAAQQAMGASPEAQKYVQDARQAVAGYQASLLADMSPERQQATRASLLGYLGVKDDATGERFPTPGEVGWLNWAGSAAAQLLPTALLAIVPSSVAAKIGVKLLGMGTKAAGVAGAATTAGIFGTVGAGQAYNTVLDEVGKATDAELKTNPIAAELFSQGKSSAEVRQAMVPLIAKTSASLAFAVNAAAGVGVGGVLRGGVGAAGRGLATRAGIGAGEGAATMAGQAAGTADIQQRTAMAAGTQAAYDPAVTARAAASGILTGAVIGAGGAMLHPGEAAKVPAPDVRVTGVDPAQGAAMSEALQIGWDRGPAHGSPDTTIPLSGTPGSPPPPPPPPGPMGAAPARPGAPSWNELTINPSGRPGPPPAQLQIAGPAEPHSPPAGGAPIPLSGELHPPPPPTPGVSYGDLRANPSGATPEGPPSEPPEPPPPTPPPTPPAPGGAGGSNPVIPTPQSGQTAPKGIKALRSALVGLGENPQTVAVMKLDALQRRWSSLNPTPATPPLQEVVGDAGRLPTDAVNTPPSAPSVAAEPGLGVGTSLEPEHTAAPPDQTASAPAEPVGPPAPLPAAPEIPTVVKPEAQPEAAAERAGTATPEVKTEVPTQAVVAEKTLTKDQELRAAAAAKRAAQKAKLAKPGETPIATGAHVGDVTTESGEKTTSADQTANTPATVERTPSETATRIREAAARAARSEGLPPALVESWVRDVTKIVQGTRSEDEAHQALAEWGAQKGPATSGAKVQRPVVADKLLRLLTATEKNPHGTGLKSRDAIGREALAESASQSSVFEHEGAAAKADLEAASARDQDAARQEATDKGGTITLEHEPAAEGEEVKSQGVVDHSAGGEKTRITTNKDRILTDLEQKVRTGTMNLAEAEAAYGTQQGGGRRREYATVADSFRKRITDEPDIAIKRELQAALDQHQDPVGQEVLKLPPPGTPDQIAKHVAAIERGAQSPHALRARFEARELERKNNFNYEERSVREGMKPGEWLAEQQYQMFGRGTADPDRAARYDAYHEKTAREQRAIERQIDDINAEHGVNERDVEAVDTKIRRVPDKHFAQVMDALAKKYGPDIRHNVDTDLDGIDPRNSRFVQVARDPRLNSFIAQAVDQAEAAGGRYTLHDALRAIINHPGVANEMRPMVELAKRLLNLAPDLPLSTAIHAVQQGHINNAEFSALSNNPRILGATISRQAHPNLDIMQILAGAQQRNVPRAVVLNTEAGATRHVETILHEAMHTVTSSYISRLEKYDPRHKDLQALHLIAQELADALPDQAAVGAKRLAYSLTNPHEVHTMLMTSPEVQAIAASRVASPEFRAAMAELGFAPREQSKSVWRYFTDWVRRALGIKAPASVSEYTLFDHIMRPMQDLTDRAAKYNAKYLPKDPVLREQATPLYNMMTDVLGERGEKLRDSLAHAPTSLADKARPARLQITNLDQIVSGHEVLYRPSDRLAMDRNPLVAARDTTDKIAHAATQFRDTFVTKGDTLVRDARRLSPTDQAAVGQLLNDATIAEAHLTSNDPKANAHLTTPEQLAALKPLQARYAALSPAARGVQDRIVAMHAEMGAAERKATLEGALATAFPDSTPTQREAFAKIARTKDGLEKFLADPDNSALAQAHGPDAWNKQRELARIVAKGLNEGWSRGDYVPLRRYGDHVVEYGEKGTPSYGFEMFERLGDAMARRDALEAAGTDHVSQVDLRQPTALREIAKGQPLANELEAALHRRPELAPHAEAIRDMMNKIIFDAGGRSDASRLKRQGIQGASTDFAKTLSKEVINTANRVGYKAHGGERFAALRDMGLVIKDLAMHGEDGQARVARQVLHEIQQRVTTSEAPGGTIATISRVASSFGYLQSLMSWSHMFTSAIETHSTAIPQIAARHKLARTTYEMSRTLAGLTPQMLKSGALNSMKALGGKLKNADWKLTKVMGDQLIAKGWNPVHVARVVAMLERTGLSDHDYYRELRRIAGGGGERGMVGRAALGSFEKFTDFMAASGHAVDVMNKLAVSMTAFHLEFKKTGSLDIAERYAEARIRSATPNYNLGNKNRFSTSAGPLGGAAAPITQFKQYGFFAYGMLGNLAKASIHGSGEFSKGEARKALAGVLASHAMMAGSLTLIADPLRYVGGLYDWISGAAKPHDYQNDVRGWMSDIAGPEVAALVARGVGEYLGASIYRRVGYANPLEIPALESYDKAGFMKMVGTAVSGAAGEDADVFANGMQKALNGDIMGGLEGMVPRPLRDAGKAYKLATQGVTDSRGKPILGANKISPYDVGLQAIGFNPTRVAEVREGRAAVMEREEEWKHERTQLEQRWLQSDQTDRAAVMSQIREFNQGHHGMPITVGQLLQQLRNNRKQAAQSPDKFGLRLPPKAAAALAQAGRFANQ